MGHCGIEITLGLLDQYEVQRILDRWKDLREKEETYQNWRKKYYSLPSYDEREKWEKENPEPKDPEIDFWKEIIPVTNFFKKIAYTPSESATIFDEVKEEENKEAE